MTQVCNAPCCPLLLLAAGRRCRSSLPLEDKPQKRWAIESDSLNLLQIYNL